MLSSRVGRGVSSPLYGKPNVRVNGIAAQVDHVEEDFPGASIRPMGSFRMSRRSKLPAMATPAALRARGAPRSARSTIVHESGRRQRERAAARDADLGGAVMKTFIIHEVRAAC
jgi:hypothetical protein